MVFVIKLIQNFWPDHLVFHSEQEFEDFSSRRPDLLLLRKKSGDDGHIRCIAKWRLFSSVAQ